MIMPKTPKNKPVAKEKPAEEQDTSTWEADQKRREYYYDDAHGYQIYEPDEDEKEEAD